MSESQSEDRHTFANGVMLLGFGVLGVGIILIAHNWNALKPGVLGDFWGGHLGAASGLAGTFFFFAALLMQRKELELQRKELRESRQIAQKQATALEKQTQELNAQTGIAKRSADFDIVAHLALRVEAVQGQAPKQARAIARVAFERIAAIALGQDRAEEAKYLARAFCAMISWPHDPKKFVGEIVEVIPPELPWLAAIVKDWHKAV